jgi:hypothetical protein
MPFLARQYQSKKTRKAVGIKVGSEGQELKGVEGGRLLLASHKPSERNIQ